MSFFTHQSQRTWQGCIHKEDSAVIISTWFRFKEVNRWDILGRHLWPRAGFISGFQLADDAGVCHLVDTWEDAYEWPEIDDFKSGRNAYVFYKIQGVTKDSGGAPLGGVTVELFRTVDDTKQDRCISDNAGNYVLYTIYNEQHYVRASKSPNLSGSTVESLIPTA